MGLTIAPAVALWGPFECPDEPVWIKRSALGSSRTVTWTLPADRSGPGQPWTSVVLRSPHGPRPSILAVGTQPHLRRRHARVPVQVARPGQGGPWGLRTELVSCLPVQTGLLPPEEGAPPRIFFPFLWFSQRRQMGRWGPWRVLFFSPLSSQHWRQQTCGVFPHRPRLGHQLGVLQLNSSLTLSPWRHRQIPQVRDSVPRGCPLQMSVTTSLGL